MQRALLRLLSHAPLLEGPALTQSTRRNGRGTIADKRCLPACFGTEGPRLHAGSQKTMGSGSMLFECVDHRRRYVLAMLSSFTAEFYCVIALLWPSDEALYCTMYGHVLIMICAMLLLCHCHALAYYCSAQCFSNHSYGARCAQLNALLEPHMRQHTPCTAVLGFTVQTCSNCDAALGFTVQQESLNLTSQIKSKGKMLTKKQCNAFD